MRFEGGRLSAALARALPDYRFQFESSHGSHAGEQVQAAYYSNDRMLELNRQFGDIWHKVHLSLPCSPVVPSYLHAPPVELVS